MWEYAKDNIESHKPVITQKQIELYFYSDKTRYVPLTITAFSYCYPTGPGISQLFSYLQYASYSTTFSSTHVIDPTGKNDNLDYIASALGMLSTHRQDHRRLDLLYCDKPISVPARETLGPSRMYFTCWDACMQYGLAFSRYVWESLKEV